MVHTKSLIFIGDFIGVGTGLLSLLNFIDNTKAVMAFIISALYVGFRLYFLIMKWQREKRMGDIELEEKEMALLDRIKRNQPK